MSPPDDTPRQALRRATEAAHRRLHCLPSFVALQRGSLTFGAYEILLLRLLGLHAPLEEWQRPFDADPLLAWRCAAPEDSLAARLRRDLGTLGLCEAAIDTAPRAAGLLPRPANRAQALGIAWVVEGSAAGGRILAKCLRDHLGVAPATGGAFFGPLPGQQARWSACCEAVHSCGRHSAGLADMQAAARATMNGFADWMDMDAAA